MIKFLEFFEKFHVVSMDKSIVLLFKMLIKEVKFAHQQYAQHLEKLKASKESKEADEKKKTTHKQIIEIKHQKQDVMRFIEVLLIDANQLSPEAEQKRDFVILAKANALRAEAKEKEKTVKELDQALGQVCKVEF